MNEMVLLVNVSSSERFPASATASSIKLSTTTFLLFAVVSGKSFFGKNDLNPIKETIAITTISHDWKKYDLFWFTLFCS